ncbi:CCR4-NOT transcription complex subunit 10 [Trichogramma pretiosum]|uniref:CCR4-NOT transcription complex subunit 10 n=1 Tax=Trichogramma pretiosum TaxID=7493 RepID=UPI0006C97F75|nr:CCR4-NOT transcription complex subunit 10 [Trichogramma pretiosum]
MSTNESANTAATASEAKDSSSGSTNATTAATSKDNNGPAGTSGTGAASTTTAATTTTTANNPSAVPLTTQERELARTTEEEYAAGNYAAAAAALAQLEQLRPQDLKVTHNKILADYQCSTEPRKHDILKKSLNAICPLPASCQQATHGPNTAPSGFDGDEIERAVIRYNQAVILYHFKQYQAALQIVAGLFALNEPMEESFVHKICVLLVELHLALGRPDSALALVNYIENQFICTPDASKSALGEQGPNQKQDVSGKAAPKTIASVVASNNSVDKEKETKEAKKDCMDVATDVFKMKLLKYKLRIYYQTLQVNLCKKEWKTLVKLGMPINPCTIFLKANMEYLRKNYKKAMKLLDSLKINQVIPEFKACGESIPVLYYNNMASIHFAMGKTNLACFYLNAAIKENSKAMESVENSNNSTNTPNKLYTIQKSKHCELMYGMGISLLHTEQPTKAFDCFIEASQQFHNSPRLWLRMAECCIMCHKPTNKADFDIPGRRKDILQKIVGENNNGVSKKFILATSLSKSCKYHPEGLSYAIPQPTLEYGMLCLKNALFLLPITERDEITLPSTSSLCEDGVKKSIMGQQQSTSLLGSFTTSSNSKLGNNSNSTPSNPNRSVASQSTIAENLNLKISILSASAYTALCLGDYVSSLNYAKSLLSIKKLPGAHVLLGNLYAAECLIFLNRIQEASEYLKPELLQDVDTFVPIETEVSNPPKEDSFKEVNDNKSIKDRWYPTNVQTAKAILSYNLAVVYAVKGELEKSGQILKQVWTSKSPECDVPIHVIMLALYIELQLGHIEVARSLIKQHFCSTVTQQYQA